MKTKIYLLISILFVILSNIGAANNLVISPGAGIGVIKLQSKWLDVEKILGAPAQIITSKKPNTNFCVYKKAGLGFLVEKGIVNGITVYSPKYKLENKISVGSSQIEVIKTYRLEKIVKKPDGSLIYPEIGLGFTFHLGTVSNIYIIEASKSN